MTYAGFFVGPVDVRDTGSGLTSDVCASKGFRYIKSRNSDGTYVYNEGVNWGMVPPRIPTLTNKTYREGRHHSRLYRGINI